VKTYPIMLNMIGRRVVVVGGAVGLRKARSLAGCGAEVTLISPKAPQGDLPAGVRFIPQPYTPRQLEGARLVFACTDQRELNARIAADARSAGALVNVADQPDDCDFFVPAVARDGEIVLAVGSGGTAPALAGRLRDAARSAMPERVGEFASLLAALRAQARPAVPDAERRGRIMKRLAGEATYRLFLRQGREAVENLLKQLIAET